MGTEHDHQSTGPGHEPGEPHNDGSGHHQGSEHRVVVDRIPAGTWRATPTGSQINVRARSAFGLLPVNGFFERFEGEMRSDADGATTGTLVVDAGSFQTGIDGRDERLRSSEFFDVAAHPQMTFTLTGVGRRERREMRFSEEERMAANGVLRIRDTDIPLEFPVTVIVHGDHLHVEAKVRIDHHAAGLGWTRPGIVGKTVRADVALTLNPVARSD